MKGYDRMTPSKWGIQREKVHSKNMLVTTLFLFLSVNCSIAHHGITYPRTYVEYLSDITFGISREARKARLVNYLHNESIQGSPPHQYALALEYLYQNTEEGNQKAMALLQHAALAGNHRAAFVLGDLYKTGIPGIPANSRVAINMFFKAWELGSKQALQRLRAMAVAGDTDAIIQLGFIYQRERKFGDARASYNLAIKQGSFTAKLMLSALDYPKAPAMFDEIELRAENGEAYAQLFLLQKFPSDALKRDAAKWYSWFRDHWDPENKFSGREKVELYIKEVDDQYRKVKGMMKMQGSSWNIREKMHQYEIMTKLLEKSIQLYG